MSESKSLEDGACRKSGKAEIFLSEYSEPFDEAEYMDFNPSASPSEIDAAKHDHGLKYAEYVLRAKQTCLSCPVLESCEMWVMDLTVPVFGVVASLTEEERSRLKQDRINVSSKHILNAVETQDLTAMQNTFA
jgi:Transcription factor WhiB